VQPFLNPTALNLCETFASPTGVSTSTSSLWLLPLRFVEQYERTYRPSARLTSFWLISSKPFLNARGSFDR
jgi:hypothetical protein